MRPPRPIRLAPGCRRSTIDLVFNSAADQTTDSPLNFAIQDDTFFPVHDLDVPSFTRASAASTDSAGNVTAFGGRLQPNVAVPEG